MTVTFFALPIAYLTHRRYVLYLYGRSDGMKATYTLNPNEIGAFLEAFKATFSGRPVRVTVESFSDTESPEEIHSRMLRALEAEKHGDLVHTMTIEKLEAMVQ
jgi:hypothetical protein